MGSQSPNTGEVVDRGRSTVPSERLKTFLDACASDAEIISPPSDAATVSAAARALGVSEAQIVKSLLFQSRSGEVVLAVVKGGYRVDRRRLADLTGLGHLKLASPEAVLEIAGFAVGGMPPVGHATPLTVVVDDAVLEEAIVFGGGGRSDLLLRVRPDEIVRMTGAVIADVADPET